jgi:hypothetical protein
MCINAKLLRKRAISAPYPLDRRRAKVSPALLRLHRPLARFLSEGRQGCRFWRMGRPRAGRRRGLFEKSKYIDHAYSPREAPSHCAILEVSAGLEEDLRDNPRFETGKPIMGRWFQDDLGTSRPFAVNNKAKVILWISVSVRTFHQWDQTLTGFFPHVSGRAHGRPRLGGGRLCAVPGASVAPEP